MSITLFVIAVCVRLYNSLVNELTVRLLGRDFYEVIVDEVEGRINYHLIEIESEKSNCFSRIRDQT